MAKDRSLGTPVVHRVTGDVEQLIRTNWLRPSRYEWNNNKNNNNNNNNNNAVASGKPCIEKGRPWNPSGFIAGSYHLFGFWCTTFLQGFHVPSATSFPDHRLMPAKVSRSQLYSGNCPPEDSAFTQRAWDSPAVTRDWHCIWDHATCDLNKAHGHKITT